MNRRPESGEYPEWYDGYVKSVPDADIVELLETQLAAVGNIAADIKGDISLFRYEQDKWSIKEVFGHLNDAERILSCRALRYLRRDKTDIPKYDHDAYVTAANFNRIPFEKLIEEFKQIRSATITLFQNVDGDGWMLSGTADGRKFTVRAMAYIIVGHVNHHLAVLKKRYLNLM
jgi:hypothetical protein